MAVSAVALGGIRTLLGVPLLNKGELIGAFFLSRQEVRPFTEKQIALVQNFAAQAVIAIENARLLNELREAVQQQTATADVLEVISRSAFDLHAVFETVTESSVRLCAADRAFIFRFDGELLRMVVAVNSSQEFKEFVEQNPIRPGRHSAAARAALQRRTVHIPDVQADPEFTYGAKDFEAVRTVLAVPILKGDDLLGVMIMNRLEARSFSKQQIALVETFADQAAIAIENVRLLDELRQRTDDLSEALEQQTATSDVLEVISSFPGDLQPVFAAMLDNAARICDANFGNIFRWDGEALWLVATHNTPPAFSEHRRRVPFRPNQANPIGNMLKANAIIHVADLAQDERYIQKSDPEVAAAVELGGIRTFVAVPMLKDDKLIGVVILYRQEVRPFSDKQIELVRNFAAQAVIAIENARLLNELRQRTRDLTEALEQQTATSNVLEVISSSPGNLEPVFATILENAVRLRDAKFGSINRWDGEALHLVGTYNVPPAFAQFRKRTPFRPGPENPISQMLMTKTVIHFHDLATEQGYVERNPTFVAAVELGGVRTFLAVPMMRENELIGVVIVYRQEVRPFSEKQIELAKNFAAQAVIAIENTRLLNELRQSLEQQAATADVLKVISRSYFGCVCGAVVPGRKGVHYRSQGRGLSAYCKLRVLFGVQGVHGPPSVSY
jgi:GAF domain-containing protein